MPDPRHLRNAPITEAIFDFRVKARAGFHSEEFTSLQSRLTSRFPKMDPRRMAQAIIRVGGQQSQPPVVQDLGMQGYFFKAADEKMIAQFRVDGFTFNRLRPYTSWEELFPLVLELWQLYSGVARPEVITRLALRYINRVPLPLGPASFETYLQSAPIVPPELPQFVSNFLTRLTIHDPDMDIAAHITQAFQGEVNMSGRQQIVILDIDAFKQGEFAIDDPSIKETFHRLRDFKNRIFFSSLTEETVRQFE